jgi:enoyl-CoA hydratase/carnithine racemase
MGAHRDKKKLDMSYDEKVADLQERQRLLTGALISVRKPTIAALPGPAAGAGLAIAMACDIRIAAESAFVSTGYLRVGLSGDYGIAWLLTRLVGLAGAGIDVYRRQGQRRPMRDDRSRQPRGSRCQVAG